MTVIPSIYEGVKMRSKSEAKFAEWCDQHEVKWVYEPEGFCSQGQLYLPDFYLPEIRTFVEIKPLIFIKECSKMLPIISSVEMYQFAFLVIDMHPKITPLLFWDFVDDCDSEYSSENSRASHPQTNEDFHLNWCCSCKKPIIVGLGSWQCRHCGTYKGDGHLLFSDPFVKEQPLTRRAYAS